MIIMSRFRRVMLSAVTVVGLGAVAHGVHAEDWTTGSLECKAVLGTVSYNGQSATATGGTAVVSCAIPKVVNKTVGSTWARLKRSQDIYTQNCTIVSTNSFGTTVDTSFTDQAMSTANQSLLLDAVSDSSNGYLTVQCVLASGDKIYGIRMVQN